MAIFAHSRERRSWIRSHADGDRTASSRELQRAEHVRRGSARRNAHDHIARRNARSCANRARHLLQNLPRLRLRMPQRSRAARDDGLHHFRRRAERRRTFGGVENGEPSAGSRADIKKPSAAAKAFTMASTARAIFGSSRRTARATRASSRFRTRRISSVDFRSSPRERGFRCSVFDGFKATRLRSLI